MLETMADQQKSAFRYFIVFSLSLSLCISLSLSFSLSLSLSFSQSHSLSVSISLSYFTVDLIQEISQSGAIKVFGPCVDILTVRPFICSTLLNIHSYDSEV